MTASSRRRRRRGAGGRAASTRGITVGVWGRQQQCQPWVTTVANPVFSLDVAAPVWDAFLSEVTRRWQVNDFRRPDGLETASVDVFTGYRPSPWSRDEVGPSSSCQARCPGATHTSAASMWCEAATTAGTSGRMAARLAHHARLPRTRRRGGGPSLPGTRRSTVRSGAPGAASGSGPACPSAKTTYTASSSSPTSSPTGRPGVARSCRTAGCDGAPIGDGRAVDEPSGSRRSRPSRSSPPSRQEETDEPEVTPEPIEPTPEPTKPTPEPTKEPKPTKPTPEPARPTQSRRSRHPNRYLS